MPQAGRSRESRQAPPRGSDRRAPERRSSNRGGSNRGGSTRGGSDLLMRVLVAIPLAAVAIGFIDVGGILFAAFMIAVGLTCLHELYRLLGRWRPVPVVGFAAVVAMVLAARRGGERDLVLVAAITVPVLFAFVALRGQPHPSVSIAGTLLGVYWIGIAVTLTVLLRELPHGKSVIIDVLLGTFIGDTAAYIGGRMFGRRALAPRISPRKTVEGLVIGALAAILTVLLAAQFETSWLTQGHALLLGVTVAVLAPVGDLFESVVKRDAGAKDTGRAFGPHGGVLDRADAALFTLSAAYFVWLAVG